MLKGLPTRLNLLTENASEWNVFAFYPSLHWEVLHLPHSSSLPANSPVPEDPLTDRPPSSSGVLFLPSPPLLPPIVRPMWLPFRTRTPDQLSLPLSSSHVSAHLSNVKEVTHRRNPTELMCLGTFWKLMWCEIFLKYFLRRGDAFSSDPPTDIKLLAALWGF